jgi:hypothetical protein
MNRNETPSRKQLAKMSAVVLLIALAHLLGTGAVLAQVPPGCKHVCNGTYALCISATCDGQGSCGQGDTTGSGGGYCYVFKGNSCSAYGPCQTSGLYSTYSENLLQTYGFQNQSCQTLPGNSNCMGQACTLTGKQVPLNNKKTGKTDMVPTAICTCTTPKAGPGTFQVLNSNPKNCSVRWSTF